MLECLKYRYNLVRLLSEKNKLRNDYAKYIATAESSDEKESRESEASHFVSEIENNIRWLMTVYYRQRAAKLIIPLPNWKETDLWEDDPYSQRRILTGKGIYQLRKEIRSESRERLELFLRLLAMIIGFLGALIGVLSYLKK
jgi:hypothetical protein